MLKPIQIHDKDTLCQGENRLLINQSIVDLTLLIRICNQIEEHCKSIDDDNGNIKFKEIINALQQILQLDSSIQEGDKSDIFVQILSVIKHVHQAYLKINNKSIKSKIKTTQIQQNIEDDSTLLISKLVQIIFKFTIPSQISISFIKQTCLKLLEIIMETSVQMQNSVDKKKNANKSKVRKEYQPLHYIFLYGQKIELQWFILLKIIQKQLQNLSINYVEVNQQANNPIQAIQIKVNPIVKELVSFILVQIKEKAITFNFTKNLIENISSCELPIVPFFIKSVSECIKQQFQHRYNFYKLNKSNKFIKSQTQYVREVFSVEELSILMGICQQFSPQNMLKHQFRPCQDQNEDHLCSFCGIEFVSSLQHKYRKIAMELDEDRCLVLVVCPGCLENLNLVVEDNRSSSNEMIIFSPMITTQFWMHDGKLIQIHAIQSALSNLCIYHCKQNSAKKKKSSRYQTIKIPQKIAMNNEEESLPIALISKIYLYYLYNHSQLSIKQVIIDIIKFIEPQINNQSVKIRKKSLQIINNKHILKYFSQIYSDQNAETEKQILNKIIESIELRLFDTNQEIKIVALDLFCNLNKQNLLKNTANNNAKICNHLTIFWDKNQFLQKALKMLQKKLINPHRTNLNVKKQNSQFLQNYKQYLQLLLSLIISLLKIIKKRSFHKDIAEEQQIYITMKFILEDICLLSNYSFNEDETIDILSIFKQSLNGLIYRSEMGNLKSVSQMYQSLIEVLFTNITMNISFIRSIPQVSTHLFHKCLTRFTSSQNQQNNTQKQILLSNFINIIEIVFQRNNVIKKYIQNNLNKKINNVQNGQYSFLQSLFSSSLIINLILFNQLNPLEIKNQELQAFFDKVSHEQLVLLGFVIEKFIQTKIIHKYPLIQTQFTLLSANKRVGSSIKPIHLNKQAILVLKKLYDYLKQRIKECDISRVDQYTILMVRIAYILKIQEDLKNQINQYCKFYCYFFKQFRQAKLIILETNQTESGQYRQNLISMLNHVFRTVIHLSFLAIASEKYMQFKLCADRYNFMLQHEFKQLEESTQQTIKIKNEQSSSLYKPEPSIIILQTYQILLEVLSEDCTSLKISEIKIKQLEFLFIIKNFWEMHPKLIIHSKKFIQFAIQHYLSIGFYIILYEMLNKVFQICNIQVLSSVSHYFSKTFPIIFSKNFHKSDVLMLQSYKLLNNLLSSGMIGLYEYTKYILYGVFQQNDQITDEIANIIKNIYLKSGNEKILFSNLRQYLRFVYNMSIEHEINDSNPKLIHKIIFFTEKSQISINKFLDIFKLKGSKVILPKQRKQLRLKTTLIKKIGQLFSASENIMFKESYLFYYIIKILQIPTQIDYFQLYEIIQSLKRIVNQNYYQIIHLKNESKFHKINLLIIYRQLLYVLCRFTKFTNFATFSRQLQKILETGTQAYTKIQTDQYQLNCIGDTQEAGEDVSDEQIVLLYEDIEMLYGILGGQIEYQHKNVKDKHGQHIRKFKEEEDSFDSKESEFELKTKGKNQGNKAKTQKLTKKVPAKSAEKERVINLDPSTEDEANMYNHRLRKRKMKIN